MLRSVLIITALAMCCQLYGQTNDAAKNYKDLISQAEASFGLKDYKGSALKYQKAFDAAGGGTSHDLYNGACAWTKAGYPDSAFKILEKLSRAKYKDIGQLSADEDFITLYIDPRWKPLLDSVKMNKQRADARLNKPVAEELSRILQDDQKYRMRMNEVEAKYGMNSEQMKKLWDSAKITDNANIKKVTAILNKYGWLGPEEAGEDGNIALFLVIQHADEEVQKKYLPMMREAVKNGKAQPSSLALLEDRVALAMGKKQIYGSQLAIDDKTGRTYFSPIEDEANVNKRRAEVGLEPIEEYAKYFGIEYKPGEYLRHKANTEFHWGYMIATLIIPVLVGIYLLVATKRTKA
jgi:hypothetical protein